MPEALNVNPAMIKWAREDSGFSLDELPGYLKDAENGKLVKRFLHGQI